MILILFHQIPDPIKRMTAPNPETVIIIFLRSNLMKQINPLR